LLNERLCGLRFSEIRISFEERVKDVSTDSYRPIIRVFLDSVDKIFTDIGRDKTIIAGTKNVLAHPEFEDHEKFQSVIELVENKDIIIHVLDKNKQSGETDLAVSIGEENKDEKFSEYSMITKEYQVGDLTGTLGIMGPKRMDYSKIIAAVVYVAEQLGQELTKTR
ncbi:MAG: HrcA family transcriptional regulator, partial [Bacteroidota bacterium]